MAELTTKEKLQPALLDRLTDWHPEQKSESRLERIVSDEQLREATLRDLTWLFNTVQMEATSDLGTGERVRASVLNFGLPSLSGKQVSLLDWNEIERALKRAILRFEPRILAETLQVSAVKAEDVLHHHNVVQFNIRGQLWAQPLPIELFLKTELDLETGEAQITELKH